MSLFMAGLLVLQASAAEETFRKIEATLSNAKSLRVQFASTGHVESDRRVPDSKVTGTLLLKEGNRFVLSAHYVLGNQKLDAELFSDGTTLGIFRRGGSQESQATPKNLGRNALLALVRLGGQTAYAGTQALVVLTSPDADFSKVLQLSDFKEESGDEQSRALSYTVTAEKSPTSVRVTLYYHPETLIPLRRKLTVHDSKENTTVSTEETYEEFNLNAQIPDARFNVMETPIRAGQSLPPGEKAPPPVPVLKEDPPPPRKEIMPKSPSTDHVWIGGYWKWDGRWFYWVDGVWRTRPKPEAVWEAGIWERREAGWVWIPGFWK